MKKRIVSLLLAVLMSASVFVFPATASGSVTTLEALPEPDILNLVFTDDGKGINDVSASPWKDAVPHDYTGNGVTADWTRVKKSTFTIGDKTYTENAYVKNGTTNSVGVDFSANKSALTAALSDGFTVEAAFLMPATTGSSQAIFAAANDGGFGLYLMNTGKLHFEVGKSGGGYAGFDFSGTFTAGQFVHVIAGMNGSKIFAYANGEKQGETAIAAFRAGGYFGAIGLGGSTASTTNYTKSLTGLTSFYSLRLYNAAFSEEQMQIEYVRYMSSLNLVKAGKDEEESGPTLPSPEILDLVFTDDGKGVNKATGTPWSGAVPYEYASGTSGAAASWTRVKPSTFTYGGKSYQVNAYTKTSSSNSIGVDLSFGDKSKLTAALANGFTVETSFLVPVTTSSSQAIFGAANGGGFGLYLMNTGKLYFEVGKSGGGYIGFNFSGTFSAGDFVHVIAGFDGSSKIYAYANGVKQGEAALTGFNGGGYFGAIGLGGSTASTTNYSKSTTQVTSFYSLRLYDTAMTEEQMKAEFDRYLASLPLVSAGDNTADILDLKFGDKTVENVAGTSIVKSVKITEMSTGTSPRETFTNFGAREVTIGGKKYTTNVFYKNTGSPTNTLMIDFTESGAEYKAAVLDGFTMEAFFDIPTARTGGAATYWGNSPQNSNAVISASMSGGYLIGVSHDGCDEGKAKLFFVVRDGGAKANAAVTADGQYADGEHIYVTAQYVPGTPNSIKIYINGELKGSYDLKGAFELSTNSAIQTVLGVGGSPANASNPTNYACNPPLNLSVLKIRSGVLTPAEVAASYTAELVKIGAAEAPEEPGSDEEDEDAKIGDSIVKLLFAKNGAVYADEHSLGKPVIKAYSGTTAQTGFDKVGKVTFSLGGKTVEAAGFAKSAESDLIGIDMSKFAPAVVSELSDGFSLETAFVVPEGLSASGYNYFIGGVRTGGTGICAKDGKLCFVLRDESGFRFAETDMPAAGTYCHVIGTYDADAKTISLWLNGVKAASSEAGAFDGGAWGDTASIGIGGTAESAVNYTTNETPAGTVITALDLRDDALTDEEAKAAYAAEMAKYGMKVNTRILDDGFEPVLRFMVTSDVHIGSATDARAAKLAGALSDAYAIARNAGNLYDKLDAIEVVGDIADQGKLEQMQAVKAIFDNAIDYDETQLLVTMGNHDYYEGNSASPTPAKQEKLFDDTYGYANDKMSEGAKLLTENRAPNTHYIINGYHFINVSVDGNGWNYSQSQVNWLRAQLDEAVKDTGDDKPIFVFHHIGEIDTVIGSDHYGADAGVATLTSVLQEYPQVVDFSGHSHQPVNTPFSLLQEGCTMVGTGTLKTSGSLYGGGATMQDADGVSLWDVSQVLVVEVDADNRTRIRVYDISKDKFMSQSWILESYDPDAFVYTRNALDDAKIFFADDAALNISNTTSTLVSFNFNTVSPDSEVLPNAFLAEVIDGDGKTVASRYLRWSFYDEDYDAILSTALGGLTPDTEYTLRVTAISTLYYRDPGKAPFLPSTNVLEKTFRTLPYSEEPLTPDILNASIGKDTVTDASGNMTPTVSGAPIYEFDETIGMNTIKFDTNSKYVKFADYKDDANDMAYGFTLEAYFRIDEFNDVASTSKSPMGSAQTGGFCFDMKPDNQVTYSVYTGSYKTISKTTETGKFYHWVCSYDGAALTVYVNGHKIGSIEAPAPMTFTGKDAQVFFLGADTTASGGAERQARTTVALARIYSQPANEAQALGMWEEVRALQDTDVYPGDDDDPEYLEWEMIDDLDEEVTIFDTKSDWVHDHKNDNPAASESTANGLCMTFNGGHLYKSACHAIAGSMAAKVSFTGTAFRYVLYYRGPAGDYSSAVDVYVDGELYQTVTDINASNSTARYVALEILGLKDKSHEITLVSHDGLRFTVDAFEIVRGTGEDAVGSLTVSKTLEGNDVEKDKEFTFTVKLDEELNCTLSGVEFKEGEATIVLKGGESKTIEELPKGIGYTVTEEDYSKDGYVLTAKTGETGTIAEDTESTASFTNTRNTYGTLTVSAAAAGEGADKEKAFSFTVKLSDETISGKYGDMTFDKGVASFTLKDGETVTASDLPNGIEYTVTEADCSEDGYETEKTGDTGLIEGGKTAEASFTNTKAKVETEPTETEPTETEPTETEPSETDPTDPVSPATGDNGSVFLWTALMLLAGATVCGVKGKKRKED